jgi:hypothetical protein
MSLCELSVQNLEKHLIINWYNNKLSKSDCETEQFLSDTHGTYGFTTFSLISNYRSRGDRVQK